MLALNIWGGFLPFGSLLLTVFCFRKTAICSFDALMRGSLIWAFALVMVSNMLSVLTMLSFPFILAYWTVYLLFFAACAFRMKPPQTAWQKPEKYVYALGSIALLTFITAVLYPPNNWDSMTYHLPKVMHWWQNNSLEHYYTSNVRQTGLSSFTGLVIFHSFILSGTDYLANLVQWSAFIGIMCMAAGTASLLRASKGGQILAALFFATLPMGIAQASSTQTDLVVGFWLSCVAARYIIWKTETSTSNAIYFGMAVGLAILTKGTGYVISFPFVIAFAFFSIKKYKQLLPKAVLAGLIAMSIFMPHIYRNYAMYNDPIAGSLNTINSQPTVKSFVVTALANILSNDPIPFTKHKIDRVYEKFLAVLRIDPNDKSIFPYGPVSNRSTFHTHEDFTQNPFHLVLLIWSLSGIGIHYRVFANRYRFFTIASVSLFCLLLAWQPWITRLQVPLFALAAPLAGIALEESCGKKLRNTFCILLVMYCIPVLVWNASRPLIPVTPRGNFSRNAWLDLRPGNRLPVARIRSREELYFTNRPVLRERYFAAVNMLVKEGAGTIGLVIGVDSWEYPLWALMRTKIPMMPKIRHIPQPKTATELPMIPQAFVPQYLFVLDEKLAWEKEDEIKDTLRLFKLVNGKYARIF